MGKFTLLFRGRDRSAFPDQMPKRMQRWVACSKGQTRTATSGIPDIRLTRPGQSRHGLTLVVISVVEPVGSVCSARM
jgi:hypothetical protein